MRTSSGVLLAALALAACQRPLADGGTAAEGGVAAGGTDKVPCARGSGALAPTCAVDRGKLGDDLVLTIRHADGAFRRLIVARDGRGVIAADGAEPAKVTVLGPDRIAVAIGNDRYELPATVKGATPAAR